VNIVALLIVLSIAFAVGARIIESDKTED